jgi:hypothetical protein
MGLEKQNSTLLFFLLMLYFPLFAGDTTNTIDRNHFNFGHQLGFEYSRMDDAYFLPPGTFKFQTGFLSFYTSNMPLVRNPEWKKRLMLTIPLYLIYYPADFIMAEFDITDLFVEFPYKNLHNIGGKSPRFSMKLRLFEEKRILPAITFTIGVKFSSAKPYTIWDNQHNYDQSNGLAGAGTGVADYFMIFTFSKKFGLNNFLTTRIGLAPLGSPVEYVRGSAQADEIPYGISYKRNFERGWSGCFEIAGMYNGLPATILAHYSVARLQIERSWNRGALTLNLEHGLTWASDEWVAGFYQKFYFKNRLH